MDLLDITDYWGILRVLCRFYTTHERVVLINSSGKCFDFVVKLGNFGTYELQFIMHGLQRNSQHIDKRGNVLADLITI